jgi:small neutral amino acid transporter SnatA (MarC family)
MLFLFNAERKKPEKSQYQNISVTPLATPFPAVFSSRPLPT